MRQYFFFQVFRKTLIQFLDTMADLKVARYTPDGQSIEKYVEVPIKLAIKEKAYLWLNERKDDQMLPMITAWITSIDYAADRQTNAFFEMCKYSSDVTMEYEKFLAPVPYNLGLTMNIWTLHMVDIDQIMEQILPFFAPHIFIRVAIEDLGIEFDVKVIFRSCTPEVSTELSDDQYRVINYAIDFELQTWFFKPLDISSLIGKIYASLMPDKEAFDAYVSDTTSTFSSGASGGVSFVLSGTKNIDGDLIIKYNLFEPS
jgi:hypothetical protein